MQVRNPTGTGRTPTTPIIYLEDTQNNRYTPLVPAGR